MAKVKNLQIQLQNGTTSTYFASWEFDAGTKTTTTTTSSGVKEGAYVTVQSGATWYNGASIASFVFKEQWYVVQIKGDRAVLGKNKAGTNNIKSPINVKYLSGGSSSSSTTTTNIDPSTLDHFEVTWEYDTGNSVWFSASTSNVDKSPTTYSAPSNALRIRVKVKPVSKTYTENDKEVEYWTASAETVTFDIEHTAPPETPSAPTVEIDKTNLTASITGVNDPKTDQIQFQVYRDNETTVVYSGIATVLRQNASFSWNVTIGHEYQVRCRAIFLYGTNKIYSEWSEYSDTVGTIPSPPGSITSLKALSTTSVQIDWSSVENATDYEIEYTTKKTYFDSSNQTQSMTVESIVTHAEITGLETGTEHFFRVRAVNEKGNSSWTDIKSIVIGSEPAAPTTWSSTTTVITGGDLTLYWVHNSEDGSSQTHAEIELTIGGNTTVVTVTNSTDEDEKDKTSMYGLNTSIYTEGTKILWRVRTKGITGKYGDWSVQRTIDVYAQPTLVLAITDSEGAGLNTITSFPFYISGLASPSTQVPIGYHVTITANESYETVDNIGRIKMVNVDEAVYSRYFDITDRLLIQLSAGNIDLENGIEYTVTCVVSMDSGLTATSSTEFVVDWVDEVYETDAGIAIDRDTLSAYISPYCIDTDMDHLVEGVLLSVYRREFDGSFTEIATGLNNTNNITITDPHPALDYARYRIVATTESTGAVSYYDLPAYPVNEKAIIIQWNEEWSNFDVSRDEGGALSQPPWTGSMLRLPYNIDVSDKFAVDTALVKYIGRKRPVTYYGTHLGETSTWNTAIPKSDEETLYALRRLAIWAGDVYVREPSGTGYWANVKTSFSQKHRDLTIPVTFEITRVEGGI